MVLPTYAYALMPMLMLMLMLMLVLTLVFFPAMPQCSLLLVPKGLLLLLHRPDLSLTATRFVRFFVE